MLQKVEKLLFRKIFCAVERHVLQKMGQSILVILFENRAYVVQDVEFRAVFGLPVSADVVGHAVVEFAV